MRTPVVLAVALLLLPIVQAVVLPADVAEAPATPVWDVPTSIDGRWIWSGSDPTRPDVLATLAARGSLAHELPRLGMVTFTGTADLAHEVLALHGGRIDAAERLDLHLDRSVKYIEADRVRDTVGNARTGPTVLVVDTGVDSAHPDFQDVLVANVIPQLQGGLVVGSLDQVPVIDTAGHGTHVGSIVAGSGRGIGTDPTGPIQGIYSQGRLASYQVTLGETGGEPQVDTLAALEAFEWALTHQDRYDIRVVTNSWGASGDFEPRHAVNQATLRLYKAGMVVTFSAGNEGRDGPDTLNKYCQAPWVLCVAAGDLNGARSSFSSYGGDPDRPYGHPDLTAPGFQVTAAAPLGATRASVLSRLGQDALYTDRSGTSMAAPHVAGTAALLLAARPALSPDQVMDILVSETDPMADPATKVGSGYLNARKAFNLAMSQDFQGNLPQFLAGQQVKYAGPASDDPSYAADPVTVGHDPLRPGTPLLAAPAEPLWVLASPVAWSLLAAACISVLIGIRWTRVRQPRPMPAAARQGTGIAVQPAPGAQMRR